MDVRYELRFMIVLILPIRSNKKKASRIFVFITPIAYEKRAKELLGLFIAKFKFKLVVNY